MIQCSQDTSIYFKSPLYLRSYPSVLNHKQSHPYVEPVARNAQLQYRHLITSKAALGGFYYRRTIGSSECASTP